MRSLKLIRNLIYALDISRHVTLTRGKRSKELVSYLDFDENVKIKKVTIKLGTDKIETKSS